MGFQIDSLVERIRAAQGPFFIARLGLRLKFPLTKPGLPDAPEYIRAIVEASRELGYDPHAVSKVG